MHLSEFVLKGFIPLGIFDLLPSSLDCYICIFVLSTSIGYRVSTVKVATLQYTRKGGHTTDYGALYDVHSKQLIDVFQAAVDANNRAKIDVRSDLSHAATQPCLNGRNN